MNTKKSEDIAKLICQKLSVELSQLKQQYNDSKNGIGFFYIDDLFPLDLANNCFEVFPSKSKMRQLKSIREYKYVSAQMNEHNQLLEDVLYAFQHKEVVKLIGEITGIETLFADESLYAGGLSLMEHDNFLNPHLDNSHDAERKRWRVLNLLYYVTPDWQLDNGGHLEIWPHGPKKDPVVIESKFNRLAVMATHQHSWHSVNKVKSEQSARCCISNYYFSPVSLRETDRFHVTKFRGRPNETLKNLVLDIDSGLRMAVRKIFRMGIRKNPHVYKDKIDD